MGLDTIFTLREVASSANRCANCHYEPIRTHLTFKTHFLQVLGFHGPWLCIVFSLPDSSRSS